MAQVYINFNQAQQQLAGIEAIDYFFAREMVIALSVSSELSTKTEISAEQVQVLMHLFMVLSVSLRAGHTCLPLTEISGVHWAVAFDEQDQCSHQGYVFPRSDVISSLLDELDIGSGAQQPLVFDNNNLYMRRYHQFECELSQDIN